MSDKTMTTMGVGMDRMNLTAETQDPDNADNQMSIARAHGIAGQDLIRTLTKYYDGIKLGDPRMQVSHSVHSLHWTDPKNPNDIKRTWVVTIQAHMPND